MLGRPGSTTLAASMLALAMAGSAHAQDPDPAAARTRAEAVTACIGTKADELAHFTRMLGEARTTLSGSHASARQRGDAAHAVAMLEQRIHGIAEAIARCTESPATTTTTTTRTTPAHESTCGGPAAGCRGDEAATIPSGTPVSEHVRAENPEKLEGTGRLPAPAVLGALRRIGPTIDACYDAFTERYAIVNGEARLVFWVSPTGVVTEIALEGLAIGDATFRSCVTRAVRSLPSPGSPEGGPVRTSVRLLIGPE